jgi:hypothetical protein
MLKLFRLYQVLFFLFRDFFLTIQKKKKVVVEYVLSVTTFSYKYLVLCVLFFFLALPSSVVGLVQGSKEDLALDSTQGVSSHHFDESAKPDMREMRDKVDMSDKPHISDHFDKSAKMKESEGRSPAYHHENFSSEEGRKSLGSSNENNESRSIQSESLRSKKNSPFPRGDKFGKRVVVPLSVTQSFLDGERRGRVLQKKKVREKLYQGALTEEELQVRSDILTSKQKRREERENQVQP